MTEQRGAGTAVIDKIAESIETNTSRKVFSDPVTVGNVTVIPAAKISGRGGGGGGSPTERPSGAKEGGRPTGEGAGGGMAQSATPIGAFVVRGGRVRWRPAVDVNRLVLGGQVVAIVALMTVRALVRGRQRRR
ncbi:MAG TPA: sporulation protein [Micromonosporaceae bacterium]